MSISKVQVLFCVAFFSVCLLADEKLVLEFDLENDVLSMSHNVPNFLFEPTRNYSGDSDVNINDISYPALANHLVVTGLVRIDNEVVGIVTEQEIIYIDAITQKPMAESMWLIRLNAPGITGFMSVLQKEDASPIFSLVEKVQKNQDKVWSDKWQMFLSTVGKQTVQFASGDLQKYQGGLFEEYDGLNSADFAKLGRFRGRIQFVIYPHE